MKLIAMATAILLSLTTPGMSQCPGGICLVPKAPQAPVVATVRTEVTSVQLRSARPVRARLLRLRSRGAVLPRLRLCR